ncbi:hypothetical protein P355_4085 [Burkholderia cenocepacia KC-01]|nr:hypothetical protein P355_4085 [Burkholderia cenocepacia KC-01]
MAGSRRPIAGNAPVRAGAQAHSTFLHERTRNRPASSDAAC